MADSQIWVSWYGNGEWQLACTLHGYSTDEEVVENVRQQFSKLASVAQIRAAKTEEAHEQPTTRQRDETAK